MNHGSSASEGHGMGHRVHAYRPSNKKAQQDFTDAALAVAPIIYIQMPMKPRIGLHAVGFIIFVRKLSPSKPDSESSQPVTVVPMFAP